jgi:hypothetical protein
MVVINGYEVTAVNDVQWSTLDNPIALTSIIWSEVFSVAINLNNTNDASSMSSYFSYIRLAQMEKN